MNERDLKRFIGFWPDSYLRHWRRHADESGVLARMHVSFSPWPLVFGLLWVWYRKMWLLAIGLTVGIAIIAVFIGFVADPDFALVLNILVLLGLSIWGPALYLSHAQRKLARIDALGLDAQQRDDALRRLGGVSFTGTIFGIVSILALVASAWGFVWFLATLDWTVD